ncbi:MAG: hypothetical protein JXB15_05685 [Anaerolineales bacterium]|nr:hypothetical protein [Anaerolineales bacterium]
MKRSDLLLLLLFGIGIAWLAASFQKSPGYMDAEYYFAGGVRLAQGHGFSEMILWNYLDDPAGLPHPSHGYWMPLVSILAAAGMALVGAAEFWAGRLVFLLLAGFIPCLVSLFSFSLTGRRDLALLAGILALFPGFYLPYQATTDSFVIYILLGIIYFALLQGYNQRADTFTRLVYALLVGIVAGVMHLVRADGLIWLITGWVALTLQQIIIQPLKMDQVKQSLAAAALCLLGYLIVMGPWMLRNLQAFGSPLSAGGLRIFWVTGYDDLFIYPASQLTLERWWHTGAAEIFNARVWAAGQNLQTIVAVQGNIFLLPLIILGAWRLRTNRIVQAAILGWLITFAVMTLVFPYVGARGGFFHGGAAVQPIWWAIAPLGLDAFVAWAGRLRRWNIPQAQRFFQAGVLILVLFLSIFIFIQRVIGSDTGVYAWDQGARKYQAVEAALMNWGAQPAEVVMVNNAPGYYATTERPAISIPSTDIAGLLEVAQRYQARYLLLEFNQLQDEDDLYLYPADRPHLKYLGSVGDTRIYQLVRE